MASRLVLLIVVLVIYAAAADVDGHKCSAGWATCSTGRICKTDLWSDSKNCGRCGAKCTSGPHAVSKCTKGKCSFQCDSSERRDCDGNHHNGCEVDIQSDKSNCGKCGRCCHAPPNFASSCVKGVCSMECKKDGYKQCGHSCIPVATDVNHCGSCNSACSAVANGTVSCAAGACAVKCNVGFTECNGKCHRLDDNDHCGSCNITCSDVVANGTASCVAGACTVKCNVGFTECNGKCHRLDDNDHCGSCNITCSDVVANGTASCVAGACTVKCNVGFTECNGKCHRLDDNEHCGSCNNPCSYVARGTVSCVASVCNGSTSALVFSKDDCLPRKCQLISCDFGFQACGGTCYPLVDNEHCGSCSNSCPDVKNGWSYCTADDGFGCVLECNPRFSSFGYDCIDLTNDPLNCGQYKYSCGSSEASPINCVKGQCVPV